MSANTMAERTASAAKFQVHSMPIDRKLCSIDKVHISTVL